MHRHSGLRAGQLPVHQRRHRFTITWNVKLSLHDDHRYRFLPIHLYQRLPVWWLSKGLTLAEIASRARKIRERTVPIGQFITAAISS